MTQASSLLPKLLNRKLAPRETLLAASVPGDPVTIEYRPEARPAAPPPDHLWFRVRTERHRAVVLIPAELWPGRKLPDLASWLEFELEQGLGANVKVQAQLAADGHQLVAEW